MTKDQHTDRFARVSVQMCLCQISKILIVVPHDAILGHEDDQPGRPAVADAKRPLQQRYAAPPLANHDIDRRLVRVETVIEITRSDGVTLRIAKDPD